MASKSARADYVLLSLFALLLLAGIVTLISASSPIGHDRFGDSYFFVKRQLLYGVLPGFFLFLFFSKWSYTNLKKYAAHIFGLALIGLILVFIPGIGTDLGTNAHSWIVIAGQSMQPAEFAKLALIIFMAAYLANRQDDISDLQHGFLHTLALGMIPIVLVILQPDIGTVSILFSVLFAMLFFGGSQISHLVGLAGAGMAGLALMIAVAPYRAARFTTFLHPELDPQGIGYHINQAFLAIGSGGLFGVGLGHSRQKFQYLPEVHADSIFAVFAEEMGFVFSLLLLTLICYIGLRGYRLARECRDPFAKLLVSGIITWILVQSFMNIGAMVGIMPLTGVPLPFISHGGTALMIAMASVGILVNVSKEAR